MPLMLALNPVLSNLLMLAFIAVAVIMILIILIQKPAGGGLSGAFGASSGGSGQTAFGAKTGDALTLMTIGTFVVFVLTAILLVFTSRPPSVTPRDHAATPVGEQVPAETPDTGPATLEADPPELDTPGEDAPPSAQTPIDDPADPAETLVGEPGQTPADEPEPGS